MREDSTSKKGKSTISKKDLKISLVSKRLSMLQEDDRQIVPVLPQESLQPLESHKRARVMSDDEPSEVGLPIACIQPRKRGRIPKKKVESINTSNDEYFKVSKNSKRKKIQSLDLIGPKPAGSSKSSSMKRAEQVQANLSAEYPSLLKLMSKSHVSGGFWLGMPKNFCDEHLPIRDCIVVLVDEAEKEFNTNYLVAKSGLSGGWRGFSLDHDLREGDVVIFHLIEPTKFKIYIIREESYGEVDGVLGLLTLDCGQEQQKSVITHQKIEDHIQKALQPEDDRPFIAHLSRSSSDVDQGPEVLDDGIRFSDSDIIFEGVKDFENFNIVIDGLIINSKFSEDTRKKYFELCHSQGSFLHEHLLKGLNCNLVVGIISETVNIADAIKSCRETFVSHEDIQIWEKTLKGFEFLGMKVTFLCTLIDQLQSLNFVSKTADDSNKLKDCIIERTFAGERMKALENKLTLLKETMEQIDSVIDAEIAVASERKLEAKITDITAVLH